MILCFESKSDRILLNSPDISLVVPCNNEEANVRPFFDEAVRTFGARDGLTFEIVYIDDGSTDNTFAEISALVEETSRELGQPSDQAPSNGLCRVTAIRFSRNFGKESAIYAGMEASTGKAVCLIDADLQQDPAVALQMYDYLVSHDDCDVVAAYQDNRKEGKAVSWLKRKFYRVFNATSDGIELPENMSDFRVFTRQVAEALLSMPENNRFSKGLFAWVGFNTHAVPYTVRPRHAGKSRWTVRSLFKYAFTGFSSFSTWPLKAIKTIGGICSFAAAVYLLYVLIVDFLILGIDIPGYPTLVCLILMFGGFQLLALGFIGDYLARDYIEGKQRPLFIVKDCFSSDSCRR